MTPASLPVDPLLPQLAQALDGAAMGARFASGLLAQGVRLEACRVDRVKYRPRRNLAVAYRLQLRDHAGAFEQPVAARFCAAGDGEPRYRRALAAARGRSRAGPSVSHWPDLEACLHWWPADPKLAAAALLADDAALAQQALAGVVAALGGGALTGRRTTLVQLVPEHRVTARVELDLVDAAGRGVRHTVYAKSDAEGRGPATHALMQALWASPAHRHGRLRVPQPLLWQPGSGLHWQAAVPGVALLDRADETSPDHARGVAALLAALHGCAAPSPRSAGVATLRERLHVVARTLALVEPAWRARLMALALRLDAGLSGHDLRPGALLHGDLHPRNVLLDEGRLALIDLDSAHHGAAVLDLGSWLADALYRALLAGRPAASALDGAEAFLRGYAAGGGTPPAPAAVAWATAYQLLCQRAWRCVVNLKPGRYALAPRLIDLAERLARSRSLDAAAAAPAPVAREAA